MASSDQAVILARGLGTRMRKAAQVPLSPKQSAAAEAGLKALMPVGRPFLDYVLSVLADAGWRRVCLVIGPEHQAVRDYYGSLPLRRLRIEFAVQARPRGTADAVAAAEAFAGGQPFLCLNADNYYPLAPLKALHEADGMALAAFECQAMVRGGNIPADRLSRFAAIQVGPDGDLARILEKPNARDLQNLGGPRTVSMNCWRLTPEIFTACRAVRPSPRGELELPDAVQYALDVLGLPCKVLSFALSVLDLTGREDVAPVALRLAGIQVDL